MLPTFRMLLPLGILLPLLAALIPLGSAGCDFVPGPNGNGDVDTNGDSGEPQPTPGPTVTIRFANLTELAVLADVYVSTNGADRTPEALFVDANRLIDGVGLASTGVLVPDSSDSVDAPCTEGMVVATTGGVFRDPNTGEDLGTGAQRILEEGLVFDCGAEITFVYRLEDDGYTVIVTLD